MAFYYGGIEVGLICLVVTALAVPKAPAWHFAIVETPMGRRLLLGVPKPEEVLPDSPQRQRLQRLVGQFGVARTMMPSGVDIGGQTVVPLAKAFRSSGQAIK